MTGDRSKANARIYGYTEYGARLAAVRGLASLAVEPNGNDEGEKMRCKGL